LACTENINGWDDALRPASHSLGQERQQKNAAEERHYADQHDRQYGALGIVRCGSTSRIAQPANGNPRLLAISRAANWMQIECRGGRPPFKWTS